MTHHSQFGTIALLLVAVACGTTERRATSSAPPGVTARGSEQGTADSGNVARTARPWPIMDSFPLQVPGETEYPVVFIQSEGPGPCQGMVAFTIRRQTTVLYVDTLRIEPNDRCEEPLLGSFWDAIHDLRSLHATLTWEGLEDVVAPDVRARYGSPPYIFLYANGWESTRVIAWNPHTKTLDVLIEGGLW